MSTGGYCRIFAEWMDSFRCSEKWPFIDFYWRNDCAFYKRNITLRLKMYYLFMQICFILHNQNNHQIQPNLNRHQHLPHVPHLHHGTSFPRLLYATPIASNSPSKYVNSSTKAWYSTSLIPPNSIRS